MMRASVLMRRCRAAILLLLVADCRKGGDQSAVSSAAAPSGAPTATVGSSSASATLLPNGIVMRGDRAMLQHYLMSVDTVVGARVRVTYTPQTVVIDRNAAIRSVRGASWDGATWHFDASEPAVAKLQSGSVMLVWGLALRKVTAVERQGDEIVVRSEPAALSDALQDADIHWNAPAHVLQGSMAVHVPEPKDSVHFRTASLDPERGAPRFSVAALAGEPRALVRFAGLAPGTALASAAWNVSAPDSAPSDPASDYQHTFRVKVKDYSVALAYGSPNDDAVNFYAQAAKGIQDEEPVVVPTKMTLGEEYASKYLDWLTKQGAPKGAKKVGGVPTDSLTQDQQQQAKFEKAVAEGEKNHPNSPSTKLGPDLPKMPDDWSDLGSAAAWKLVNLTAIKVTAVGRVSGLQSNGDISYAGGQLQQLNLAYPALKVSVDLHWVARLDSAVFSDNALLNIPITFRAPLILGGIPLVTEIGCAMLVKPALTSKNATAKGSQHFEATSQLALRTAGPTSFTLDAAPEWDAQKLPNSGLLSLGVSGMVVALQGPRVGLGIGFIGTNVMAYFDLVAAMGAAHTGMLGLIRCTHWTTNVSFNGGMEGNILGVKIPIARKTAAQKNWTWDDPPGTKCG